MTINATKPSSARRIDVRMSPRDLINIGIFGALYVVTVFAINMLGFINPAVMLVAMAVSIIAGGVPFMLFVSRVQHAGMVTIFAIVTAGLMLLTGHPPISFVVTLVCGLVADAILALGRYRSRRMGVLAYAVYAMWFIGPMLPIFYARDDYFSSQSMAQMGSDYVESMDALLSPAVLVAFDISTAVFGLIGGLLGLRLLRKHFEKAGLA
ncbi:MptD family putative ECF transporter S component [Rhodococcus sp. NPDC058521]|uniref:MptD family putative ECF transporter S component n=1 Tax=Rhodococcus sp. NPDC058521 TaxID=3346536 RepID=UPI00365C1C60